MQQAALLLGKTPHAIPNKARAPTRDIDITYFIVQLWQSPSPSSIPIEFDSSLSGIAILHSTQPSSQYAGIFMPAIRGSRTVFPAN